MKTNLFIVETDAADYEQCSRMIISANNMGQAINIANFELKEINEHLGIEQKQKLSIKELKSVKSGVIMKEIR